MHLSLLSWQSSSLLHHYLLLASERGHKQWQGSLCADGKLITVGEELILYENILLATAGVQWPVMSGPLQFLTGTQGACINKS